MGGNGPHRARARRASAAALALAAVIAPAAVASAVGAERAAPVNTVSPTISGKPRVGETLSASQGEWQGSPTSFFFQWLRCDSTGAGCVPVDGAVGPQYALTMTDVGARMRVEVIAANADGSSPARRSAATAVIRIAVPAVTAKPTISGAAREGQTLSATTGQWSGSPTAFEYQWKRCANGQCSSIPGATAPTYVVTAGDVGFRIRVRVEARNDGGSATAQSNSTPTVSSATAGFRLGPARHDEKRGLVRFRVEVPTAGVLRLARTAKVRGDHRRAAGPRTVKLTVRARGSARQRLHRRGRARVRVRVRFASDAGPAVERKRRVTLRAR